MKQILALLLCVSLTGCGGEDDLQPIRDALDRPGVPSTGGGGSTSGGNDNGNPSVPTPDSDSLWEYRQDRVSRFAKIDSLNTVPTTNSFNDAIMTVEIEKRTTASSELTTHLTITVFFADTACDVSCNIRIKKNGNVGNAYPAKEFINGVFTNDSFSARDLQSLIKDVTLSNNASITLPLTDVPAAEFTFDFSGYDTKFMR